jgi:hypothetical protein
MKKLTSPFILIKKSFDKFAQKENITTLVQIYLPAGALSFITLLPSYVAPLYVFLNTSLGTIVSLIFGLLYVLTLVFVNLAGIAAVIKIVGGQRPQVKRVYKEALSKYGIFLLLTTVTYLLYVLSLILLVVPFILAVTWLAFSKFVYVEKGIGIRQSLLESRNLVRGNFWAVFGRIIVFSLFSLFSQIVLTVIPYELGLVVFQLCGALFLLPSFLLYREVVSGKLSTNELSRGPSF